MVHKWEDDEQERWNQHREKAEGDHRDRDTFGIAYGYNKLPVLKMIFYYVHWHVSQPQLYLNNFLSQTSLCVTILLLLFFHIQYHLHEC